MSIISLSGQIVDIINRKIFPGTVSIANGKIASIVPDIVAKNSNYILPGFVDSHIHIESSMLIPSEFARLASIHGTVATVSDPHEIANVLGIDGIRFMIQNSRLVPFHFYFGASSCVPATSFETAGASLTSKEIETLFRVDGLKYLSEMMNFPGVLNRDPEVIKKIEIAKAYGKPVDGHAPGLKGKDAEQYIAAGISTDHECFALDEALNKIKFGMQILIREGSAAKNYDALHPLIKMFPEKVMFCCDDKHPHELVEGHINQIVQRSIAKHGYDVFDVLRAATLNPILHYKLDVGLLRENDSADFIVVKDLKSFEILETYVKGNLIAKNGETLISSVPSTTPNHFSTSLKKVEEFAIPAKGSQIHVIKALNGEIITQGFVTAGKIYLDHYVSDIENDILKIAVINRYQNAKPAIAFIKNFGLKKGAIASSIAHDSHNIVAVGCNDEELCKVVNLLIENKGGVAVVNENENHVLPLPVAGLMSKEDAFKIAQKYAHIDQQAKLLGTTLYAPFMTLSFMALLVIPELKLSDKGLFDTKKFDLITLECS